MILRKLAQLAKKYNTLTLYTQSDGSQWLSIGHAAYSLVGLPPSLTMSEICMILDIPPERAAGYVLGEMYGVPGAISGAEDGVSVDIDQTCALDLHGLKLSVVKPTDDHVRGFMIKPQLLSPVDDAKNPAFSSARHADWTYPNYLIVYDGMFPVAVVYEASANEVKAALPWLVDATEIAQNTPSRRIEG